MILAVDIGNTKTAAGLVAGSNVERRVQVWTDERTRPEVVWAELEADLGPLPQLEGAILCSVVPLATPIMKEAVRQGTGLTPIEFTAVTPIGITNRYEPPSDVGPDRLVNAYGAWKLYGLPSLIVDIGTALTVDYVNERAEYLGGVIAPGIGISLDALHARTAMLPKVDLEPPPRVLGTSTVTSIQSGITHGYALMIGGLVDKLRSELAAGQDTSVVITGGYTAVLKAQLEEVSELIDPDLTLKGLALIHEAFAKPE